MNDRERKAMIEPELMMLGKEEVDNKRVLTLFYPGRQPISQSVVCTVNRFEIGSLT